MAGTFTYDLTTEVGKVRLRLTDTREGGWFIDEEIQDFLDEGGSVWGAVYVGASVLLMDAARRLGPEKSVQAMISIRDHAAKMSGKIPTATVTMPGLLPMDTGWSST